ncbi:MAG TPA: hypothetical protein DCZ94_04165 [Lentisphaeria bacterium]|nr:MAG: hypothetical protein A2X48_05385 [Lentisphaerae bacterium GWF2_49_21]HBC86131.1 hypothetical protein [Lentisphaeria bacterium]
MKKTKSNSKLEKALKDFIGKTDKAFTAENAAESIALSLKVDAGKIVPEIEKLLLVDNSLLDITKGEELRETYVTRTNFFDKAEFCISPAQDEIDNGILFPGHRFMPFLNPEIPPFEAILKPDELDMEFELKTVKDFTSEDLELYHSLMGIEMILQYYALNDKANAEVLKEKHSQKTKLNMKVFDMKEFYRKHSFKMGDSLILSVDSSDKGIFCFSFLPGSEKQEHLADIQSWVLCMEEALLGVFEVFGPDIDIQLQLEQALIADPSLMENVYISYGEFLKVSQKIWIKPVGTGKSVLWRKDENPIDSLPFKPEFSVSTGSVDSLDKILQDLGIGFQSYEIEAFMRDELYNGRKFVDGARKRCFAGRELAFRDEAQRVAFENFIDELWEEVIVDYNRSADEGNGKLRSRSLAILEDQIVFMRRLDSLKVNPDQLPKEEILSFSDISIVLGQLLNVLNNSGNQFEKEEIDRMLEMLDQTVETISNIKILMIKKVPGLGEGAG